MTSHASYAPPVAFCEDVDEGGKPLPETRISASANVAVKRSSKADLDLILLPEGSVAGDSGYSSRAATIASASSDPKEVPPKVRRVSLRLDTAVHPSDSRDYYEGRPRHIRQGSSSHGTSGRSRSTARRELGRTYERSPCRECDEVEEDDVERLSRRFSRDVRINSVSETPPPATIAQPRPRPARSNSYRSSSSRPMSVDLSKLSRDHTQGQGRERGPPPSAWTNLPSPAYGNPPPPPPPQYMLPHPPQQYVSPVTYNLNPAPSYPQARPALQPLQRSQTVYSAPSVQQGSRGSVYSATPIRDDRFPEYQYSESAYDSTSRRQHNEEIQRIMMPPPPRPGAERSSTTTAAVNYHERPPSRAREGSSRRPSDLEPVSPTTIRPPNRKSASYEIGSKRHSADYSLSRRQTLDSHEGRRTLEAQLYDAEAYQRHTDIHPRMPVTPDSVRATHAPSHSSSHQSRSSRGSARKSGSSASQKAGSLTVVTDEYKINFNDTRHQKYTVSTSDSGIRLTVGEKSSSYVISRELDEARPREGRRERRVSRDLPALERETRYSSRSRHPR